MYALMTHLSRSAPPPGGPVKRVCPLNGNTKTLAPIFLKRPTRDTTTPLLKGYERGWQAFGGIQGVECTKLGLRPSNSPRHGLTPLPTVLNMCPTVLGWACISFIASCVHRRLPSRFTLTTASMVPWLNSENGHRPPLIPALLIQKWTVLDAIVTIVVARSGM